VPNGNGPHPEAQEVLGSAALVILLIVSAIVSYRHGGAETESQGDQAQRWQEYEFGSFRRHFRILLAAEFVKSPPAGIYVS
jgi:hypothetical protein